MKVFYSRFSYTLKNIYVNILKSRKEKLQIRKICFVTSLHVTSHKNFTSRKEKFRTRKIWFVTSLNVTSHKNFTSRKEKLHTRKGSSTNYVISRRGGGGQQKITKDYIGGEGVSERLHSNLFL